MRLAQPRRQARFVEAGHLHLRRAELAPEHDGPWRQPQRREEARVLLRRQVGDLPADKLNRLANIEQDYSLMAQELRANSRGGPPSPADSEKLALLEKERRADIAKLLTSEELLEFQMHYSPTSNRMRRDLALFKPIESEYRALFPILDTVEQQFPSTLAPPRTRLPRGAPPRQCCKVRS
ncbi:MAG: hypothetical protein ABIZ81_13140 [Opitutaceae bacterium]